MMRALVGLFFAFTVLLCLHGCAGSGSGTVPQSVRIEPTGVTVPVGGTAQFTAFATGGENVPLEWRVVTAGGGTISSSGLYTAPASAGTYEIEVRFATNPDIKDTVSVTVSAGVSIGIVNANALPLVIPQSRLRLVAVVNGASNTNVTWTSTGGSVNQDGTFVAPAAAGVYTITARSTADSTKTASVQVEVITLANVRMTVLGRGDILVNLATQQAPRTTANFVSLVNEGFYDGTRFHRLGTTENPPIEILQGGDPLSRTFPFPGNVGSGGPGYTITFEANPLTHTQGALAMARATGLDTAGSQFYFCRQAVPALNGNYVVFGNIVQGLDVMLASGVGDQITAMKVERP